MQITQNKKERHTRKGRDPKVVGGSRKVQGDKRYGTPTSSRRSGVFYVGPRVCSKKNLHRV